MKCKLALFLIAVLFSLSSGFCQSPDSIKVRKTNPTGALLRSALVPGWGQVYNRKYVKAVLFASVEGWLAYGVARDWRAANRHETNFKSSSDPDYQGLEFSRYEDAIDRRNVKMWCLALAVFYSMFDAYVDAQLSDFDQPDKAFEVNIFPRGTDGIEVTLTLGLP